MGPPLFAPAPTTLGLFFVGGIACLGLGYGFMTHPRRAFVVRHPLVDGRDSMSDTGVAVYQAWGFLLSVVGVGLWTALALGTTTLPAVAPAGGGVVAVLAGVTLARADSRRRQDAGVAVVVLGLGLLAGGGVALAG